MTIATEPGMGDVDATKKMGRNWSQGRKDGDDSRLTWIERGYIFLTY